jgi:hypothetical protein
MCRSTTVENDKPADRIKRYGSVRKVLRSRYSSRVDGQPLTGAHTPDGTWWWDGSAWSLAFSRDRRWWFDGRGWVPAPSRAGWLTRHRRLLWVFACVVVPLAYIFAIPMAFGMFMTPDNPNDLGNPHNPLLYVLGCLVAVAGIALLVAVLTRLTSVLSERAGWSRVTVGSLVTAITFGGFIILAFVAEMAAAVLLP